MDTLSKAERSAQMARVKGRDTTPEMIVRRLIHGLGHRYRLHASELPGKPDIVFRQRRKAIFVHGCFWHGHDCARGARMPKTNREYWFKKIARNEQRDAEQRRALARGGWKILTVWECETRDLKRLTRRITRFLIRDKDQAKKRIGT